MGWVSFSTTKLGMFAWWLTSCNGLFYQPLDLEILSPQEVHLPYQSHWYDDGKGNSLKYWQIDASEAVPHFGEVIQLHGNGENMTTHFLFLRWLPAFGFHLITVDYPGYGESKGELERTNIFEATRDFVRFRVGVSSDHSVFLLGQSLGGAIAVPVVATLGKPVKGLILDSPFNSYREMAQDVLQRNYVTYLLSWPLSYAVSDELSPRDFAAFVKQPTLAFHAADDSIVPLSQGQLLFDAIGSDQKRMVELPEGGHTAAFGEPVKPVYRAMLIDFLCDHAESPAACHAHKKKVANWW